MHVNWIGRKVPQLPSRISAKVFVGTSENNSKSFTNYACRENSTQSTTTYINIPVLTNTINFNGLYLRKQICI